MYTLNGRVDLRIDAFWLIGYLGGNICCLMPPCDSCVLINFFLNLQQIVAAINAGIIPLGNTSNQISHWDLGSSFFFAGTVITTIGRRQLILLFNFGTACELKFICLNFFTVGQNGLLKVENLSLVNWFWKESLKVWTKEWWKWITDSEYRVV